MQNNMTAEQWVEKLITEGYSEVMAVTQGPNTEFPEHTHDEHTVHVIVEGEFILIDQGIETTLKAGERVEIPAGTTHRAKCGSLGCTFVVGVKT